MVRPKILYLATDLFWKGGIPRYSRYQVDALRSIVGPERVRVYSMEPPREGAFEDPFPVDYSGLGSNAVSKVDYSARSIAAGVFWKPDIVWINHVHLLPLATRLRGGSLRRLPVIVNAYGLELWSGRNRLIERFLPRVHAVIADAHFSKDYVIEHFGMEEERVRVVWDCVDTSRFRPSSRRTDLLDRYGIPHGEGQRYILTLGRLTREALHKGYERLLEAMAYWRDDPRIVALFAGDGNERPRLERLAHESLPEDRVVFLGNVPERELVDVYNLAHVFSLVSDWGHGRGEGVPLVALEAAACEKPIIVGDEDGAQEAVVDGVNGYVVSPRDPRAFRERIEHLVEEDGAREAMGKAARERVIREFSVERFLERTREAIRWFTSS